MEVTARCTAQSFQDELRAAQTGDERAFASLFRAVQPMLLRYLGGLTYNLADGTADDVAAETWVQVVRGLDRFRGDEQGYPGLGLHDRARKAGRRPATQWSG